MIFRLQLAGDNPCLDFCGDNPRNLAGNDPLNLVGEIYSCTPLGVNFQSLLGMMPQLRWGNGSTGDILYSTGEHSYIPLRNTKTAGDTLMLAGEYLYTPLGKIKTFWGYPTF